ncbi:MAG: methyltransferase type 11, partial [Candidatus Levybacteria bacterium GW2011_GWA1_39_11]
MTGQLDKIDSIANNSEKSDLTYLLELSKTLLVKNYAAINRDWWNKATPIHASSKLYDLEKFKKGKTSLQATEIQEVGNVRGKTLLHLLCHFGMDTLSWARRGADATGVDISDRSIRLARKLSREIGIPAKFICSDIHDLPKVLDKKFDIIFASYGVLLWLSNIKKFAKIVNHFLSEKGMFYIVELHPFTNILSCDLKIDYKYFQKGPHIDDSNGTYTDWSADIKGFTYNWNYTLEDIINSLINEGLKIEYIHEFPYTMYDQFPGLMEKNKKGQYVLKDKKIQIP